jgi:hypothetical protein
MGGILFLKQIMREQKMQIKNASEFAAALQKALGVHSGTARIGIRGPRGELKLIRSIEIGSFRRTAGKPVLLDGISSKAGDERVVILSVNSGNMRYASINNTDKKPKKGKVTK